jgi:hypothetical protein
MMTTSNWLRWNGMVQTRLRQEKAPQQGQVVAWHAENGQTLL